MKMNRSNISISEIETYLHSKLKNVVSKNTYAGTLPDTIQSTWDDMCLIDCANAISNFNAYSKGQVLIFLYTRPRSNGAKNVAKMSELENNLNDVINNIYDDRFMVSIENRYSDYDETRQWHCNIIVLDLVIV